MKKLIPICVGLVMMLGCSTEPKKVDIISQINKDIEGSPAAAGGVNYYICDDGDDQNDGLSSDAPWRTYAKGVQAFNSMSAGDSVLFCRGGVFNIDKTLTLYNFNCRTDNPCTIGDYTPDNGSSELPILEKEAGVIAALYFKDPRESDHEEGVIVRNLHLSGVGDRYGVHLFNDIDDVLLEGLFITGFERGVFNGTGNTPNPGSDILNERIVLDAVSFGTNKYNIVGSVEEVNTVAAVVVVEPVLVSVEPSENIILSNKTFYICDTGSDANTGLSPESPWYSYSRVASEFRYFKAGDSVAFCRGGVIDVTRRHKFINTECRADNPCVFKDYYAPNALGNEALPILRNVHDYELLYFTRRENDTAEGIVVKNLELIGNGIGVGVFVYNGVSNITLHNLKISNFRVGVDISRTLEHDSHDVSLTGSTITNSLHQGWLGGCGNCTIDGNYFENNGHKGNKFFHNIYFSGHYADNVKITNNVLYHSAMLDGKCTGVSLVVHGTISNLLIENNTILEDRNGAEGGCFAIGIGPAYSDVDEWFKGVVIRENTIVNTGAAGIACGSCEDVLVENNVITHSHQTYHAGIMIPQGKEDTVKSNKVTIRGNQINMRGEPSRYLKTGINLKSMSELIVEDNSIQFNNADYSCITIDGNEMGGVNKCELLD